MGDVVIIIPDGGCGVCNDGCGDYDDSGGGDDGSNCGDWNKIFVLIVSIFTCSLCYSVTIIFIMV